MSISKILSQGCSIIKLIHQGLFLIVSELDFSELVLYKTRGWNAKSSSSTLELLLTRRDSTSREGRDGRGQGRSWGCGRSGRGRRSERRHSSEAGAWWRASARRVGHDATAKQGRDRREHDGEGERETAVHGIINCREAEWLRGGRAARRSGDTQAVGSGSAQGHAHEEDDWGWAPRVIDRVRGVASATGPLGGWPSGPRLGRIWPGRAIRVLFFSFFIRNINKYTFKYL
jgi:hypothetical protein